IGCADVANLMLTRSGSRQRELAIRAALGASPARVTRQLLSEGLVLASIGGAVGLLLAFWGTRVLLAFAGTTLPRAESIGFDARVLLFTAALSLVTPLLFGALPALRAAMGSTFNALKEGTHSATPGRAGNDLPLNVLERRTFTPDASARRLDLLSRMIANTWTAGAYFEALGIPLKEGRFFTDADGRGSERVVIINEQLARALWPTQP